jgi:hypothetical protein
LIGMIHNDVPQAADWAVQDGGNHYLKLIEIYDKCIKISARIFTITVKLLFNLDMGNNCVL